MSVEIRVTPGKLRKPEGRNIITFSPAQLISIETALTSLYDVAVGASSHSEVEMLAQEALESTKVKIVTGEIYKVVGRYCIACSSKGDIFVPQTVIERSGPVSYTHLTLPTILLV